MILCTLKGTFFHFIQRTARLSFGMTGDDAPTINCKWPYIAKIITIVAIFLFCVYGLFWGWGGGGDFSRGAFLRSVIMVTNKAIYGCRYLFNRRDVFKIFESKFHCIRNSINGKIVILSMVRL